MPRSEKAKQWKPDHFGQQMIDQIAFYTIIAERCSAHLRSLDFAKVEPMWTEVKVAWNSDAVNNPTVMAPDEEGRKEFHRKCKTICTSNPRSPEDYIRMIFAAHAGLQSTLSQDLYMHPFRGEIDYRAGLKAIEELHGQSGLDTALEFDRNICEKGIDFLHETFHCLDEKSGRVMEFTVVDCTESPISGERLYVRDEEGQVKQLRLHEFKEMFERRVEQ